MLRRRPTYRQLEAFVAVLETGSITRAAERLHISQPALSRLITNFEADLGYPMFRRTAGRLIATAEADLMREEVQNALGAVDRACRRAQDLGTFQEGRLSISAFPSLAASALPRLLAEFRERHPRVRVTLNAMSCPRMLEEVSLLRADFAISDLPGRTTGVIAEHLSRYHAVCVAKHEHRFAAATAVSLTDIAEERFVSLGEEDEACAMVQQAFLAAGVDIAWTTEVSLCASACAWVAAVGGVAIVDPFAAATWEHRLTALATVPPIAFDLWLLRSEAKPLSRVASAFLQVVRDYLTSLTGDRRLLTANTARTSEPTPIRP